MNSDCHMGGNSLDRYGSFIYSIRSYPAGKLACRIRALRRSENVAVHQHAAVFPEAVLMFLS